MIVREPESAVVVKPYLVVAVDADLLVVVELPLVKVGGTTVVEALEPRIFISLFWTRELLQDPARHSSSHFHHLLLA